MDLQAQNLNQKPDRVGLETTAHEPVFLEGIDFAECHASSISALGNGQYLVVWFAGSHEKHDDVGIWSSKGSPGNWSKPEMLVKVREEPHWNPVLFKSDSGTLYLYFKVGKEIDEWETWVQQSEDNGLNWSEPKELVPGDKGGRGPVRNHMLVGEDGSWLAPASLEKNGIWNAFVDISEDQGKSWKKSDTLYLDRNLISGEGVIQPALWESKPGNIHMLLRTSAGKIGRSDSFDGGKTWEAVTLTSLPNNNSGIDLAQLELGFIALVYNPVSGNWGARHPIQLAVSFDNGHTWPFTLLIEEGVDGDEFSYPSLIYEDGYLVLTYTWNRKRIVFWKAAVSFLGTD